jgi:hypothetical protein
LVVVVWLAAASREPFSSPMLRPAPVSGRNMDGLNLHSLLILIEQCPSADDVLGIPRDPQIALKKKTLTGNPAIGAAKTL